MIIVDNDRPDKRETMAINVSANRGEMELRKKTQKNRRRERVCVSDCGQKQIDNRWIDG